MGRSVQANRTGNKSCSKTKSGGIVPAIGEWFRKRVSGPIVTWWRERITWMFLWVFTVLWLWPTDAALWAVARDAPTAMTDPVEVARLVAQWVEFDWLRVAGVGA